VTGPVALEAPPGVETVRITSAAEMYEAVLQRYEHVDVVFKAAAVADYEPVERAKQKMKKTTETLTIQLQKTKDILQALGERKKQQILVGFAAETCGTEAYARKKLERKNLDFVAANDVTQEGAGFGTETNIVTLLAKDGKRYDFPLMSKREVAQQLLRAVAETYA
jgi:phosphopantothenoylcysteine decarboxylase/phosphopantothenate--cysteine ligase